VRPHYCSTYGLNCISLTGQEINRGGATKARVAGGRQEQAEEARGRASTAVALVQAQLQQQFVQDVSL
jgi:hypothetical protein